MLFIVYAFDHPFSGQIEIKPKAYQIIYNYDVKTRNTLISPEKTSGSMSPVDPLS